MDHTMSAMHCGDGLRRTELTRFVNPTSLPTAMLTYLYHTPYTAALVHLTLTLTLTLIMRCSALMQVCGASQLGLCGIRRRTGRCRSQAGLGLGVRVRVKFLVKVGTLTLIYA